mmetsp:Transcript_27587/g.27973  ORF Transcript_27587/g.27973 Transcript_27587/m.27973 type:complete len:104 (+) Transcript_27587:174-485(+)
MFWWVPGGGILWFHLAVIYGVNVPLNIQQFPFSIVGLVDGTANLWFAGFASVFISVVTFPSLSLSFLIQQRPFGLFPGLLITLFLFKALHPPFKVMHFRWEVI